MMDVYLQMSSYPNEKPIDVKSRILTPKPCARRDIRMKRTMDELEKRTSELSIDSLDDILSKENKSVRMNDSVDKAKIATFVSGIQCVNCQGQATVIGIYQGNQVYVCDPCNDLLWN